MSEDSLILLKDMVTGHSLLNGTESSNGAVTIGPNYENHVVSSRVSRHSDNSRNDYDYLLV